MRASIRVLPGFLVPAVVLVVAGPALGQGSVGAAPSAPAPPSDARVTEARPWTVVGTAAKGRSLRIDYRGFGGCESTPVVSVAGSATAVTVSVTTTVPAPGSGVACPAIFRLAKPVVVPVGSAIAGRPITGAMRFVGGPYSAGLTTTQGVPRRLTVPDVQGLRAADARRVLCAAGFASTIPGGRRGAVTRTTPAAGRRVDRDATDRQVQRRRAGPKCGNSLWDGARRVVIRASR